MLEYQESILYYRVLWMLLWHANIFVITSKLCFVGGGIVEYHAAAIKHKKELVRQFTE